MPSPPRPRRHSRRRDSADGADGAGLAERSSDAAAAGKKRLPRVKLPADPDVVTVEQWQRAMRDAPLDKATMDSLVMNWLIVEGYAGAAEQFQQESGAKGSVPLSSIAARTGVRAAISQGRVDDAIRDVETMLPTLMEKNAALRLQMQQQQLVELIRAERIEEALAYARTHLRAGSAHEAPALQALEGIMSLLAFSALPLGQNPMAHLLDQKARTELAAAVNDAILEGQFACKESTLQRTAKHGLYAQNQLSTLLKSFPTLPLDPTVQRTGGGQAGAAPVTSGVPTSSVPTSAASSLPPPSISNGTPVAASSNGTTSASAASAASAADAALAAAASAPVPPLDLLNPGPHFEALAAREVLVRRAAEAAAARELARVERALQRQRKAQRREAQRQQLRLEELRDARLVGQAQSLYCRDIPSADEESAEAALLQRQHQRHPHPHQHLHFHPNQPPQPQYPYHSHEYAEAEEEEEEEEQGLMDDDDEEQEEEEEEEELLEEEEDDEEEDEDEDDEEEEAHARAEAEAARQAEDQHMA